MVQPEFMKTILRYICKYSTSIISVLFISIFFPAVLADYNQRAVISKVTYEVDYKAAKAKVLECQREHDNYLHSLEENASSAELMDKYYNIERIQKHMYSETYLILLRSLSDTYNKSLKNNDELLARTSYCYRELDNLYQNLAISLDLVENYKQVIEKSDIVISKAIEKRNKAIQEFKEKLGNNFQDHMLEVMISEDENLVYDTLKKISFHDLAMLQMNKIDFEQKLFDEKQSQITALNEIFTERIGYRFHHGILSYFSSFFKKSS